MALPVGQKAFDMIVRLEDVSETWYNSNAAHPVWPGGNSGVTIGIGYDLGQQTDAVIIKDWLPDLGQGIATALSKCHGITGPHAQTALRFVRGINIPWNTAMKVFRASTLPRYAAQTEAALPNCELLPPDAFGALVSIGYNRGNGSWTSVRDRYREMAGIRQQMIAKTFDKIPELIMSMQRLWDTDSGVYKRRKVEADMFRVSMIAV